MHKKNFVKIFVEYEKIIKANYQREVCVSSYRNYIGIVLGAGDETKTFYLYSKVLLPSGVYISDKPILNFTTLRELEVTKHYINNKILQTNVLNFIFNEEYKSYMEQYGATF
jgi:hypothetical protein